MHHRTSSPLSEPIRRQVVELGDDGQPQKPKPVVILSGDSDAASALPPPLHVLRRLRSLLVDRIEPPLHSLFAPVAAAHVRALRLPPATARLRAPTLLGALLLSFGLATLGFLSFALPALAADSYGMPMPIAATMAGGAAGGGTAGGGGAGGASARGWVGATGLRDFAIAVCILRTLYCGVPSALPVILPGVMLVAAGDVVIAAACGEGLWPAGAPHLGGVVAVGVLWVFAANDPGCVGCG